MTYKWNCDVLIIGAGLTGYTAAHFTAKSNLSVMLLEKSGTTGGRAKTNTMNGHYFNLGPHAVYRKGVGYAILEQLGIMLSGQSPKLDGELYDNGSTHAAPVYLGGMLSTTYLNWKERLEWLNAVWHIFRFVPEQAADQTYQQWIEKHAHSEKVRHLLRSLGRLATYCHAPELVSAKTTLSHIKQALGGVLYLDGGWQSMIDQLHNRAVLLGVEVKAGSGVKQIEPLTGGGFRIVLTDGEELLTKTVIYTAGPQELLGMLGEHAPPVQQSFFSRITPIKGAVLDVALSQLPRPKRLFAIGTEEPYYYSVHSNYARLSDNRNAVILHVQKYLHPAEQADPEHVKTELEHVLEQLQPGWKSYKLAGRFMPHVTVNQRLPKAGDNEELKQALTAMPGLYLAGDWSSPDYMLLDGALSSAKAAAERLISQFER